MRRGCLATTSRADVQSQPQRLMGETGSTGAAGEGSKARRMEYSLLCEWMMWLRDSEGRDRAGSEADFKGILRIHSLPGLKESIPVDRLKEGLYQDSVAAVAELQTRGTV